MAIDPSDEVSNNSRNGFLNASRSVSVATPSNLSTDRNGAKMCLVIGSSGFLGSHLVAALARTGYRVRALDVRPPSSRLKDDYPSVDLVVGNAMDNNLLRTCLRGVDVLLPFGGSGLPATSNENPLTDVEANLIPNVNLFLEAARAGVSKIVFPSSGGTVYGNLPELPANETHSTNPISSYGIVKLASEKYLELARSLYGIEYVVLRYGNPYGSGQDPRRQFGAVSVFLRSLADDRPIEIWGDGSAVRDFVYIDDAIEATLQAIKYSGQHRILNIGSGVGVTLLELVKMAERVTCIRATVNCRAARQSDVSKIVLDISRAKAELKWTPRTSLPSGVDLTWRTFCSAGEPAVHGGPPPGVRIHSVRAEGTVKGKETSWSSIADTGHVPR